MDQTSELLVDSVASNTLLVSLIHQGRHYQILERKCQSLLVREADQGL